MVAQDTRPSSTGQGSAGQLAWLIVSVVVALIGLYLLVQSADLGMRAAEAALAARNGMDSQQFYHLIDAQAAAYRLLGGVLLAVGSARALFSLK